MDQMDRMEPFLDCLFPWGETMLSRCNQRSEPFGLALSRRELEDLAIQGQQALLDTGRMEFGAGCLEGLVAAFCASPYLQQADYAAALGELQEIFYHWKNACRDRAGDQEILSAMAAAYDRIAHGSTDYLAGLDGEEIWSLIQTEELPGREEVDE